MTEARLFWLSGVSLILGGLLATAGWLLFARFDPVHRAYDEPFWLPFNFLVIFGGFLLPWVCPVFTLYRPGRADSWDWQALSSSLSGLFLLISPYNPSKR
jgi:hypothetical protein